MHKGRVIGFVLMTAALTVAFLWQPRGPSVCMSKNLLGVSCPGCGMTRSVTAAAHAGFGEAFRLHAFGPFVLGIGIVAWALLGVGLATNKDLLPDIATPRWTYGLVGALVLLILYWLVRLITHTTP